MSKEQFVYIKSGISPYDDGSGFRAIITVEQETEHTEATISLESIWRMPVSEWPKITEAVYRMLKTVRPASPSPQATETPHE